MMPFQKGNQLAKGNTHGKANKGKTYSTKGKTWDEIYGPEYAAIKREQTREISKKPKSTETKQRLSATRKHLFAEGRLKAPWAGKSLPEETKRKIADTRRKRYGTRASINKKVRFTSKYKEWRTRVFERDNFTCQECGTNSSRARCRVFLEAHHKVELWKLIGNKCFEEAMEDPTIWDQDNAITLCSPCHKKIPVSPYWEAQN